MDVEVLWQSPLLSGHVDLAPVGAAGRPRVLVRATAGFADLVDEVTTAAPRAQVRHGIYRRAGDWLPGQLWRSGRPDDLEQLRRRERVAVATPGRPTHGPQPGTAR